MIVLGADCDLEWWMPRKKECRHAVLISSCAHGQHSVYVSGDCVISESSCTGIFESKSGPGVVKEIDGTI